MFDPRIQGIGPNVLQSLSPKSEPQEEGPSFKDAMMKYLGDVQKDQSTADRAMNDLAVGSRRSLHEVMIQVEKAELSFRMLMAVRGKVMAAYQEIMRMHF